MLSRRQALKLTAAGLIVPALNSVRRGAVAQDAMAQGESGSGPSLDQPIIIKWTYDTGVEFGTAPVVFDGVAYGSVEGAHAFAVNSETGVELWRTNVAASSTEPVIADGLVYICAMPGSLVALDSATGTERWRFDTNNQPFRPTFSEGAVYVGSENGPFYALDAVTGTELWRFNAMQIDYNNRANAQVKDGTIFVTAGTPVLFALDATTGQEKWSFRVDGYATATPILDNGMVYLTGSEHVYAVDELTGDQQWVFAPDGYPNNALLLDDGLLYAGTTEGTLSALDTTTGEVVWQYFPGGYGPNVLGADATSLVFDVATGGGAHPYYTLHSVNKLTGSEQWKTEGTGNALIPAVAGDGTVIVGERHSKLPDSDFGLYALDTATGAEIWRTMKAGGFRFAPTVAAGNLYAISQLGTVYCLGNPASAVLAEDTVLRAAPSSGGIERGTASAGTPLDVVGATDTPTNPAWIEVTVSGVSGWIPISAIDPATLPPQGDVEYVHQP